MKRVVVALCVAFACLVAGCGGSSSPSPTHVAAVFFDGVNHGDFRQTCSVWQTRAVWRCEAGLTVQLGEAAISGEFGGYRVVPRSVRMWRTGRIEYATVRVDYTPGGQQLTAHLRKRPGGSWLVWYVA